MSKPDTAMGARTAPQVLCERANGAGHIVAFRAKRLGIYREYRWRDYLARVAHCARALDRLNVARGDCVALMAGPCMERLIVDFAAQALGAVVLPIEPTASAETIERQVRQSGAVLLVCENGEKLDGIVPAIERLPRLTAVLVIDAAGLEEHVHLRVRRLAELLEQAPDDVDWLERRVEAARPADPAAMIFTQEQDGRLRQEIFSQHDQLSMGRAVMQHLPSASQREHRMVASLPLDHAFCRLAAQTLPLVSNVVSHFGEPSDDRLTTLLEVAPTILVTEPPWLERLWAMVTQAIERTSPGKRRAYELSMRMAQRSRTDLRYWLAQALVFRPVLDKIGFGNLELLVCDGAMSVEACSFWRSCGTNVIEMDTKATSRGRAVVE